MDSVSTDRLVLVALHEAGRAGDDDGWQSVRTVVNAVSGDGPRLSRQVEIAAAIEELVEAGLVDRTNGDQVRLTEDGRTAAADARRTLEGTTIELVDGNGRREIPLGDAADRLDRSLVDLATNCTDDGVYYLEERPDEGFVGRNAEREQFDDIVRSVTDTESGGVVVLTGPGGIGKTRLADTMLDALPSSVDAIRTRCRPSATEPFEPIRTLLGGLDGPDPLATDRLDPDDHESFSAVQSALFHDVTEALTPEDGVRVIFIDDVEAADPASTSYLEYLLGRIDALPIVFLAAHRPGALPEDHPLAFDPSEVDSADPSGDVSSDTSEAVSADTSEDVAVVESSEGPLRTRMTLSGFSPEETRRLIEATVGRRGAPEQFVDAVHERTGGVPLFVEATVEALLSSGDLDAAYEWYPDEPAAIGLPEKAHQAVLRQLDAADEVTRDLMVWLAVASSPLSERALTDLVDVDADRIATILDGLVTIDVLVRSDDGVALRSNVVREAILDDLDEDERRRRHETLAETLEALASDFRTADDDGKFSDPTDVHPLGDQGQRPTTIARHYERGDRPERAIQWYWTASGVAEEVYAHETAIESYHRILDLARDREASATLLDAALALAAVSITVGTYDRAEQYVQFVRERLGLDEGSRAATAARIAAELAIERGNYDVAIEAATDGLASVSTESASLDAGTGTDSSSTGGSGRRAAPDRERCRLLAAKATAERNASEYDAAEDTAERLRALAEDLDATAFEAEAIHHTGVVALERSEYDRARSLHETALDRAVTAGDRHLEGDLYMALGIVAKRTGDFERAAECWTDARAAYEAVGDVHQIAKVSNNLGLVAKDRGDYDGAADHYRTALEELERIGDQDTAALVRVNLGNVAGVRSEYDAAREHLTAAVEGFEAAGSDHHAAVARLNLGDLLGSLGDIDGAREQLEAGEATVDSLGDTHRLAQFRSALGRLAWIEGRYETAADRYEDAIDRSESVDSETVLARARLGREQVELARPAGEPSAEQCERALDTLQAAGQQADVADATRTLARVQMAEGDLAGAEQRISEARAAYESLDDEHGTAATRHLDGLIALERGDTDEAEMTIEAAIETYRTLGVAPDRARAERDLGRVALAAERPERAAEQFDAAVERFASIGAPHRSLSVLDELASVREAEWGKAAAARTCARAVVLAERNGLSDELREWSERGLDLLSADVDRQTERKNPSDEEAVEGGDAHGEDAVPTEEWFRDRAG